MPGKVTGVPRPAPFGTARQRKANDNNSLCKLSRRAAVHASSGSALWVWEGSRMAGKQMLFGKAQKMGFVVLITTVETVDNSTRPREDAKFGCSQDVHP